MSCYYYVAYVTEKSQMSTVNMFCDYNSLRGGDIRIICEREGHGGREAIEARASSYYRLDLVRNKLEGASSIISHVRQAFINKSDEMYTTKFSQSIIAQCKAYKEQHALAFENATVDAMTRVIAYFLYCDHVHEIMMYLEKDEQARLAYEAFISTKTFSCAIVDRLRRLFVEEFIEDALLASDMYYYEMSIMRDAHLKNMIKIVNAKKAIVNIDYVEARRTYARHLALYN